MVQTFATNSSGNDLYIGLDGNLAVLSGLAAVEAACATASKAQLGEMVLAMKSGIPNFQTVWVGVPNIRLWESYLRATLQNVEGVNQVTSITAKAQSGSLSYDATISTPYGPGEVSA
jgi:hypothetical protein